MDCAFKVAHKVSSSTPGFDVKWRDGQLIECNVNGFYDLSVRDKMDSCIIRTTDDFWTLRGSTDWKSTLPAVMEFKKNFSTAHQQGARGFSNSFSNAFKKSDHKYKWEVGYEELTEGETLRKRDMFVDYKWLLDEGHITQAQFDSIYDNTVKHLNINLSLTLAQILRHEDNYSRRGSVNSEKVEGS